MIGPSLAKTYDIPLEARCLIDVLKARGMSGRTLAARCGIDRHRMSEQLRGRQNLDLRRIRLGAPQIHQAWRDLYARECDAALVAAPLDPERCILRCTVALGEATGVIDELGADGEYSGDDCAMIDVKLAVLAERVDRARRNVQSRILAKTGTQGA